MSIGTDEGTPSPTAPPKRRIIARIIQWRNWSLAVKLTAVVLVPVTFALALGVLQIDAQIRKANEYARLDAVVSTAGAVRATAVALQDERTSAAEFLSRKSRPAGTLRQRFAETDRAVRASETALDTNAPTKDTVVSAREQVQSRLAALGDLRSDVLSRTRDPVGAIESYDGIVHSLLGLDRALIGELSATELGSIASRLHELGRVGQEMRLQQAWVLVGALRPELAERTNAELHASEIRRRAATEEFRAAAPPWQRREYDRLYLEPAFSARENSLRMAIAVNGDEDRDEDSSGSTSSSFIPTHVWDGQSRAALSALNALQDDMERDQHHTAFALHDSASDLAGLESVILLSALLTAGAVVTVFARQLLRSLETLRASALETANTHLPSAIAEVRTGKGPQVAIKRVPVHTTEEVGQVARAFDDVQTQAVNLAAEQAELRKSYSDSFINVSRRSQSLLERQLRLFERLERDEEDPDQLATLFQLDHLATRMRRNNENLMVLSGTDLTRRFTRPVPPADLVRAAISEIEHYPRVIAQPLPEVEIVGYAASDLVRLMAELLDNAANFSAPHTTVGVSGAYRDDGSLEIVITDQGIGMSAAELASANERLATDRDLEISTSRRMGLFVVARLAHRHGIGVFLSPGPADVGVRVTIRLRAELLLSTAGAPVSQTAWPTPSDVEDTLVQPLDVRSALRSGPAGRSTAVPTRNGAAASRTARPPTAQLPEQTHPTRRLPERRAIATAGQPRNGVRYDDATVPTPIFDHLASAWFQSDTRSREAEVRWPDRSQGEGPPPAGGAATPATASSSPAPSPAPSTPVPSAVPPIPRPSTPLASAEGNGARNGSDAGTELDWSFTSDEDRRRAEEVTSAEPTAYTQVGLPVRVPRANLLAGSARSNESGSSSSPRRNPTLMWRRMSSFQEGIRRGRHRHDDGPDFEKGPEESATPSTEDSGPPTDWLPETDITTPGAGEPRDHGPEEYTAAGLPRRTPRAQLAPGLAGARQDEDKRRDADQVRGRLSEFQRGVREGKHSLRDPED